jgi:hypothetical protein
MKDRTAPDGFLRFSDAVTQLAEGMWGGLRQAEPVRTIKKIAKKASIGFGPWREGAGKRLTTAARKGEVAVYAVADRQRPFEHLVSPPDVRAKPEGLPISVLKRLITSRGTLSDYPIRPSIRTADGDHKLFELLTVGVLLVRANDFAVWYRSERAKGKWPSQRSRSKIAEGRPTKQTEAMRNAVIALVRDQKWTGEVGITKLQRILIASGRSDIPSPDTLTRLVDQLHQETGEPGLFRKKLARRKRKQKAASK